MEWVLQGFVVYLMFVMFNIFLMFVVNYSYVNVSKRMGHPKRNSALEEKLNIKQAFNLLFFVELMCYLPLWFFFWIHKDYRIPKMIYERVMENGSLPSPEKEDSIENEEFLMLLEEIKVWKKENDLPLEKSIEGDIKILYNIVFEERLKSYKEILK